MAVFAYRRYRQLKTKDTPWEVPCLIGILALVGVGSFLFHTYANVWSELADMLPILLFQVLALWTLMKRFLEFPGWFCALLIVLFVGISQGISMYVPDVFLNGSAGYLPSLAGQWLIAYGLRNKHRKAAAEMWNVGALFLYSLLFRSLDMQVCENIPIGTHFIWHSLNALMLYTVISATLHPRNTNQAPA